MCGRHRQRDERKHSAHRRDPEQNGKERLTKLGRTWIQKTKEQMLDRVELLLERVGKEDVWQFIRLSQKIKAAMEE